MRLQLHEKGKERKLDVTYHAPTKQNSSRNWDQFHSYWLDFQKTSGTDSKSVTISCLYGGEFGFAKAVSGLVVVNSDFLSAVMG
jgi:hypothetical protein